MHSGVLVALFAFFIFCCADALIKSLGGAVSVFEIGFFITIFAFATVLAFSPKGERLGAVFEMKQPKLVLGRAFAGVMSGMTVFYAFANLPFAESYALVFLSPAIVTVMSIFFLGEEVRWRRWLAVAIGLAGVLTIVRPGFREILPGHFAALASAFMTATTIILVRKVGNTEKRIALLGTTFTASLIINGLLMLPGFIVPTIDQLARFAAIGVLGGIGHMSIIAAARTTPANMVGSAHYSQIVWAAIIGAIFFSEIPDKWTIAGIVLVCISGLITVLREGKRGVIAGPASVLPRGRLP